MSALLKCMAALSVPLLLTIAPRLVEARSYGGLALGGAVVVVHAWMGFREGLSLRVRGAWVVLSFLLSGLPGLVVGGERGATIAYFLAALVGATLFFGWRTAAALMAGVTALVGLTTWGHATGTLPLAPSVRVDANSVEAWGALWLVLVSTGTLIVVAIELIFRQIRALLEAQHRAVTERERALEELVEQRQQRQSLVVRIDEANEAKRSIERALADTLSAVNAGYWETDLIRGDVQWSDGMFRLFGYEPGEVTPSNDLWQEHTHPDDYAWLMGRPLTERADTEYRITRKEGEKRWFRSIMHILFDPDGRPVRLRGIVTDVTEERAQASQLARLAEVASRTANSVVVTDLQSRIEWVNDAFTRLTGWTLPEVVGKKPSDFLAGADTDRSVRRMMGTAVGAVQSFDCEILNYTRGGRPYWVRIESRVSYDAESRPTGFIALETDVTEQRVTQQREELSAQVSALLLASSSFESVAEAVMRACTAVPDVRVAQVWLVEGNPARLVHRAGAASEALLTRAESFVRLSRALQFARGSEPIVGVGLPGAAWGCERTIVRAIQTTPGGNGIPTRRGEAAHELGIHTLFAAPIVGPEGVLGVVEFGTSSDFPGHERLQSAVEMVASKLGAFVRQDRSRRAFETVFARSPDALLLVHESGQVRQANGRADELFGAPKGAQIQSIIQGGVELVRLALSHRAHNTPTDGRLVTRAATGVRGEFSAEISVGAMTATAEAIVAVRDLTERRRMEDALTRSLREKEVLLREVHHRVKNNLQIVSSMLSLQSETVEQGPAREALSETVFRVRSMSYVHQQLYSNDNLEAVDLADYARLLTASLKNSLDPTARIELALEPVEVSIDVAVPCGLILNELITNALKHGRGPDGRCDLEVGLARDGNALVLVVADRGPGIDASKTTASLGLRLMRSLARQLRGQLTFTHDHGTRAALRLTDSARAAPTHAESR